MDLYNAAAVRQVWAYATPLSQFVERRAEQSCPEAAELKARRDRQASTLKYLGASIEFGFALRAAVEKARTATVNDLVAGRLVGLGRTPKSRDIQPIDSSFWVDAEIDWEHDAMARARKKMVAVRVVLPDAMKAVRPTAEDRPGPHSERELILAAIEEYAKKDPALRRPPAERYEAYRAFITKKGRNPRRERGFSESAFEKYELEYRQRFK